MDSDGKTSFVTYAPYRTTHANSSSLIDVNWTVNWVDNNTILICRDKQDMVRTIPKCFVLKRRAEGNSLINIIGSRQSVSLQGQPMM